VPKKRTERTKKPTRRAPVPVERLPVQYLGFARDDLLDAVAETLEHHDLDDAIDIVEELLDVPPEETELAASMFQIHHPPRRMAQLDR
jgi:hypothetical protein